MGFYRKEFKRSKEARVPKCWRSSNSHLGSLKTGHAQNRWELTSDDSRRDSLQLLSNLSAQPNFHHSTLSQPSRNLIESEDVQFWSSCESWAERPWCDFCQLSVIVSNLARFTAHIKILVKLTPLTLIQRSCSCHTRLSLRNLVKFLLLTRFFL